MAEAATLTPILFSQIAPSSTIKFSYQTDALVFDVPSITAASISVSRINEAGDLRISAGGKVFTLINSHPDGLLQEKITPMTFVFRDGSKYMFGAPEQFGGAGNDQLVGSYGRDVLKGLDGNDRLIGGGGDDILYGGAGNDYLDGGSGEDTLVGGAGNDTYIYQYGRDRIVEENTAEGGVDTVIVKNHGIYLGGSASLAGVENVTLAAPGTDSLAYEAVGNALNNVLIGNSLNNMLDGSDGNDTLRGEAGDDRLMGGNGNDTLLGGAGYDKLDGGAGNDILDGGDGIDFMIGGDGNDTYHYTKGDTIDERSLVAAGGVDTVIVKADTIDLMSSIGLSGVENVTLAAPTPQTTTSAGINPLSAFGNDLNNVMVGNALNNMLNGGNGNDTLRGEAGSDRLYGGNGNDTLLGGAGNDHMEGHAGNDILDGGDGADYMSGGDGNDTYHYTKGDSIDERSLLAAGGVDTVIVKTDYIDLMAASGLTAIENATLAAPVYSTSMTTPPLTPRDLLGNSLNNVLTGNTLDNYLNGRAGNDKLLGGAGHDRLIGEAGNDSLYGEAGNDRLEGGIGDDYLDGGDGSDSMIGGEGHDTYVYTSGDQIIESDAANGGVDTVISKVEIIDLGYFGAVENATLAAPVASTSQDIDQPLVAIGNGLSNILKGNALNNHLDGRNADDKLYGYAGNDTLLGGEGNDLLDGGVGSDKLEGGSGNDVLIGGAGFDIMNGGIGADLFVINSLSDIVSSVQDVDIIYADSLDKIDLSRLDANLTTTTTNEAFQYIGSNAFTAAGQIRIADGYLFGNNDADAEADFAIKLVGLDANTFTSANLIA